MSENQDPDISGLRMVSIGKAANNKALKDADGNPERILQVTPIEQLNMLDGELVSLPFDSEASGVDASGTEYSTKVILDTAVTASWLQWGSNRATPPDVRRGERVILFRYKDTDQYYWKETGWDDHLRRLETVHYRFSATPDETADMSLSENYYHLMISTHEGMIHLETTQKNKEKAIYGLQFNTKDGIVVLYDDLGNFVQLESVEKIISMQNGDGTLWQLDKKKLYGYASESMHVIADQKIHFETKEFVLDCQTGQVNASSSFTVKTPTFTVESDTNMFDTPNTTFTGNVSVMKSLSSATGGGNAVFKGPVTFEQLITANGIKSSAPIQGPSQTI